MINKDVPCKICHHLAERHYINIATDAGICTGCADRDYTGEQWHSFIGDNLKYLELQNKKKELLSDVN